MTHKPTNRARLYRFPTELVMTVGQEAATVHRIMDQDKRLKAIRMDEALAAITKQENLGNMEKFA